MEIAGANMGKHLVLAGGGHAHMMTMANLQLFTDKGHRVTVIGPSEHHYYSGMGPGMLGGIYTPDMIRFQTRRLVETKGGRFLLDTVTGVDPGRKTLRLQSGETITYDLVSFNIGSQVPSPWIEGSDRDIFRVKPIEQLLDAQNRLLELGSESEFRVGIVGGGPSSAEIGGNIHRLLQNQGRFAPRIRIFSGQKFMARFPAPVRSRVISSLKRRSIEILEQGYTKAIRNKHLVLESGHHYEQDLFFLALGVKPSALFQESGLPTGADGGLLVNDFLQVTDYPDIFGGGDCITFQKQSLDKVGVYAVRQNPVLLHNLQARLAGDDLKPFDSGGDYLLIFNLGDGTGVLKKHNIVFNGRLAFRFKDWIDKKFMKTYQLN